eukprot:m.310906 g.310906  ORF g.310906 m.310906 type:complete len:640 (+) comp55359_c0_seq1:214-2133(+)
MGCCAKDSVAPQEGEKIQYDPNFNGPLKNRSCTDILMLILYIAFWVGMFVVAGIAIKQGDPDRFIYGADSYGNICHKDNKKTINHVNSGLDMTGRDYLFYFNPAIDPSLRICVAACPSTDRDLNPLVSPPASLCLGTAPYSADTFPNGNLYMDSNGCPLAYLASEPQFHRCVPNAAISAAIQAGNSTADAYQILGADGIWGNLSADFETDWRHIIFLCILAAVLAFIFILMLRFIAPIMIWVMYWGALVTSIGAIVYAWLYYKKIKSRYDDPNDTSGVTEGEVKGYLTIAVIASIVGGVLAIILIVMFSRIKLVVALFREASVVVAVSPFVILTPFVTYACMIVLFIYIVIVFAFLYSIGSETVDVNSKSEYTQNVQMVYVQAYHIFGFFWASQFLLAFQEMLVAGVAASYYFTRDKSIASPHLISSYWRTIRYHLGTIAFGSLIIAIIKMIRFVLSYIQKKTAKGGKIVKFILCCVQCCLWCFEKCMKFLNRNAYIETAIFGYSFCNAARHAFMILLRNILRVAAVNSIGSFVLFLGKLIICACSVMMAFVWFERVSYELHYPIAPLIIVGVFAYVIASIFLDVYAMVIDTLLVCFCEDQERNDGSAEKPYFMSSNLLAVLSRSDRKKQEATMAAARN